MWSRIVPGAPFRCKNGHSKTCGFCARGSDKRAQEHAFRSHDANFFRVHLDALGQRAQVVPAVTAPVGPHPPAGLAGEGFERLRCDARPRSRAAVQCKPKAATVVGSWLTSLSAASSRRPLHSAGLSVGQRRRRSPALAADRQRPARWKPGRRRERETASHRFRRRRCQG